VWIRDVDYGSQLKATNVALERLAQVTANQIYFTRESAPSACSVRR
jgi:Flp pilus assembly protein CpaB